MYYMIMCALHHNPNFFTAHMAGNISFRSCRSCLVTKERTEMFLGKGDLLGEIYNNE